jgi:hypothetical protein
MPCMCCSLVCMPMFIREVYVFCMPVFMCEVCVRVSMCVYLNMCVCMCDHLHACMCVCMHVPQVSHAVANDQSAAERLTRNIPKNVSKVSRSAYTLTLNLSTHTDDRCPI